VPLKRGTWKNLNKQGRSGGKAHLVYQVLAWYTRCLLCDPAAAQRDACADVGAWRRPERVAAGLPRGSAAPVGDICRGCKAASKALPPRWVARRHDGGGNDARRG
jgi:hypothetical protein